jgi:hypothetical protein
MPRIVIVGKYPPIEGGVSRSTFVAARELARRGHEVVVVTNSAEADGQVRSVLFAGDESHLEIPSSALHPGSLTWVSTSALPDNSYVPWAQPFASKLIGRLLTTLHHGDVVLAFYLEPYAVAAHAVASAFDAPLIVQPAGSDVGRLALQPDLRAAYRRVLDEAAAVIVTGRSDAVRHIAPRSRVHEVRPPRLPSYFRQPWPVAPLSELTAVFPTYLESLEVPAAIRQDLDRSRTTLDPEQPTLLTTAKSGCIRARLISWGALIRSHAATASYSWMSPPRSSRRRIAIAGATGSARFAIGTGAWRSSARWGLCSL